MNTTKEEYDWCGIIRNRGVIAVVIDFGQIHLVDKDNPHKGMTPCPSCGKENRHENRKDKRGAIGLTNDGLGWRCFVCPAKGDAVTLASYLAGENGKVNSATRHACERVGLLPSNRINRAYQHVQTAPVSQINHLSIQVQEPRYPPNNEVRAFISQCCAIDHDTEVLTWIASRKIDPQYIAQLGVALALPNNIEVPKWAFLGQKPWNKCGYRFIVPLYDSNGDMRSIHARLIIGSNMVKSINPKNYEIRGLAMLCQRARSLLKRDSDAMEYTKKHGLIIAEGVPDWLTWLDAERSIPVISILSGSWTHDMADKIPDECTLYIATDADATGDQYADKIKKTFKNRKVNFRQWKPPI